VLRVGCPPSEGSSSAAAGTAANALARSAGSAESNQPSNAPVSATYGASTAPNRTPRPHMTAAPFAAASSQTARTRRVLPTPASPCTNTVHGFRPAAALIAAARTLPSSTRPAIPGSGTPGPPPIPAVSAQSTQLSPQIRE
jgi:hypothetical protein